jgi:hypothetical protein
MIATNDIVSNHGVISMPWGHLAVLALGVAMLSLLLGAWLKEHGFLEDREEQEAVSKVRRRSRHSERQLHDMTTAAFAAMSDYAEGQRWQEVDNN